MPGIARRLGKPAFRSSGLRRLPGADRDDVMALDRSLLPHRCGEDGIGGFADDPLLLCLGIKFAMDSLLEEAGFEPSVPGSRERGPPIVREQVANRFPGC
jgi:hypothetical protein